jgi:RNA polymerase sigma factor (sigma-70 family)
VAEFGEDIDRYPALTDREKEILALYYLLDADAELPAKGLSMREVGARLGITKQRVEQIKSNAIKKLRAAKAS